MCNSVLWIVQTDLLSRPLSITGEVGPGTMGCKLCKLGLMQELVANLTWCL